MCNVRKVAGINKSSFSSIVLVSHSIFYVFANKIKQNKIKTLPGQHQTADNVSDQLFQSFKVELKGECILDFIRKENQSINAPLII